MPTLSIEAHEKLKARQRLASQRYRLKNPDKIREYSKRRWRNPDIRARMVERHGAWIAENKDWFSKDQLERHRKWREQNREALRVYANDYNRKHPEMKRNYYQTHREQKIRRATLWAKANPEKVRASDHKRRIAKSVGSFTSIDLKDIYKLQNGQCYWCHSILNGQYEIDHLIPLAKNGTNHRHNIVLSCFQCNRRKHAKMPFEFAGRLF